MPTQTRTAPAPPVVDERVVRLVAGATLLLAVVVLATGWWGVLPLLAADFAVRAGDRTRWSPLARLARAHVRRRRPGTVRPVAARPKRFAAGIGTAVSGTAALAVLGFGAEGVAVGLVAALLVAALLEAAFGLCVGCRLYALPAAAGLVDDCPECRDLSTRFGAEA